MSDQDELRRCYAEIDDLRERLVDARKYAAAEQGRADRLEGELGRTRVKMHEANAGFDFMQAAYEAHEADDRAAVQTARIRREARLEMLADLRKALPASGLYLAEFYDLVDELEAREREGK